VAPRIDLERNDREGKALLGEPVAMRRPTLLVPLDRTMQLPLTLAGGLRATFADAVSCPLPAHLATLMRRLHSDGDEGSGEANHGASATETSRRSTLLIGGREVAMIFADVRLRGVMDGIDLAREVKMRWPDLPVILTSGHPRERVGELPPGVAYMPKPWRLLEALIAAEHALASRV
jgi:CheY-like chemotaxis protein